MKQQVKLWSEYKKWLEDSQKETTLANDRSLKEWAKELEEEIATYERKLEEHKKARSEEEKAIEDWDKLGWLCKIGTERPKRKLRYRPYYPITMPPFLWPNKKPTVEEFMDWCSKKYGFEPKVPKKGRK